MKQQSIGVIDSGVGGLTVARELMRQLPKESFIYLGDTRRCPYGPRSEEEVRAFTWQMVNYLLAKNIKMLVVACNTATAYTLAELQDELEIPVVGVIDPGAREASFMLAYHKMLEKSKEPPVYEFYTTGDVEKFRIIANSWFDDPVEIVRLVELEHVQSTAY